MATTINVAAAAAYEARAAARARRRRVPLGRRLRAHGTGYLFMLGAVALLRALLLVPHGPRGDHELPEDELRRATRSGSGCENYRHIFADPDFWAAWRTSALFTLFALVLRLRWCRS